MSGLTVPQGPLPIEGSKCRKSINAPAYPHLENKTKISVTVLDYSSRDQFIAYHAHLINTFAKSHCGHQFQKSYNSKYHNLAGSSMISTTRIITSSTMPPKCPASSPINAPEPMGSNHGQSHSSPSVGRIPNSILDIHTFPSELVPMGYSLLNAAAY